MRKYYTRPCNFYYGDYTNHLVKKKKALPLTANKNISFDQLEIFERKKRRKILSKIYKISEIKSLNQNIKSIINNDLKNITSKRKSICGIYINVRNQ